MISVYGSCKNKGRGTSLERVSKSLQEREATTLVTVHVNISNDIIIFGPRLWGQSLRSWKCTMCSTCHSSASASRRLSALSTSKRLTFKKICLIMSTPLLFLKKLSARLATSQSNSWKWSGRTIPTGKPPGNMRTISVSNIRSSFSPRSRDEILS